MTRRLAEIFANVFSVIVAAAVLVVLVLGFFAIQEEDTVTLLTSLCLMLLVVLVTGPMALLIQIHNYLKFMARVAGYDDRDHVRLMAEKRARE